MKTLTIDINGIIGWDVTQDELLGQLSIAETDDEVQAVDVRINSFGGDVQTALSVFDRLTALDSDGCKVHTHMAGLCASAATVIAMAGSRRTMSPYGLMLIHRASVLTGGNRHDLDEATRELDKIDERLLQLYTDRTGHDRAELEELMDRCHGEGEFITPDEALAYGFVTEAAAAPAVEDRVAASIAGRLVTMQGHNLELQSRIDSMTSDKEELNAQIDTLNTQLATVCEDNRKMENRVKELAAELDRRPTACNAPDGETFADRWQQSDLYKYAAKELGMTRKS